MAFWNVYPNRKDHRKPSKKYSVGCMNHGSCSYCESNRKHHNEKRKPVDFREQMIEIEI